LGYFPKGYDNGFGQQGGSRWSRFGVPGGGEQRFRGNRGSTEFGRMRGSVRDKQI